MTVFLTILKVIGIVLLILIGILLTAALLVLLAPVRYSAQGTWQEKPVGTIKVSWLAHLVTCRAAFDEGLTFCVRLAGIQLLPKREKKKKRRRRSEKEQEESTAGQETAAEQESGVVKESESGREQVEAPGKEPAKASDAGKAAKQTAAQENEKASAAEQEPVESVAQKAEESVAPDGNGEERQAEQEEASADGVWCFLDSLLEKVYAIFRNCGDKYAEICAKIEQVRKTVARYLAILQREETKQLAALTFGQLRKILRHVLPGKLQIYLCVGTGDPASTGQILAVQGMLYPFLGQRLQIEPDFDRKRLEGNFYMKGHITLAVLLACALRIVINRNFRKLMKMLRKKEEA